MEIQDREALDAFFAGHDDSRRIFDALHRAVAALGETEVRVGTSQVAFRRKRPFAWAWRPEQYLGPGRPPLVLTVGLRRRDGSTRWKEVVEPARGRFTHHLELHAPEEVDEQVRGWLREAWERAAPPPPADPAVEAD
ncbi:MAG TPA: DUF5655 domain-containing protein [Longimicrobium sp.]|nr:DUF5655 domain-containing protein [Longimicrobium sp.]